MWETPAFFLLPCYETIKNYNHLPKSRRLDILRYIAPFSQLILSVVEQTVGSYTEIDSSFNVAS
jgi:hypothetical protein